LSGEEKDIMLTPEELVRQLYIYKLNSQYEYPYAKMQVEYPVSFGREKKGQILQFSIKQVRQLHI